jgi:hypothetical protein
MIPRFALAILLPFLLLASAAEADQRSRSDPCQNSGQETACFLANEQAFLGIFALATAESYRANGTQIRRAMFVNGYGSPLIAVEFLRAAGQSPQVRVYAPRESASAGPAQPALTAPVPLADWEELEARGSYFHRALAPEPPRTDDVIEGCLHGWTYVVESTDPEDEDSRRRLRRRAENGCGATPTSDFAAHLARLAVRLVPGCSALDLARTGPSAATLSVCARFDGDQLAAASVYNQVADLIGHVTEYDYRDVERVFHGARLLDWNGARIERDLARAWLDRVTTSASFGVTRIHGENARRVRLEGTLDKWTSVPRGRDELWSAPVVITWMSDLDRYQIEEVRVGAFALAGWGCGPGYLTGACP